MKKIIALVLVVIFLVSATMVALTIVRYRQESAALEALAATLPERTPIVQKAPSTAPSETKTVPAAAQSVPAAAQSVPTETDESEPGEQGFHRYDDLYARNPDLLGWIQIEGTVIDYPVMYTPEEPEKYLRKNFDGAYSVNGLPFMDAGCYVGCGNYLIYGHNLNDGSMFASIMDYRDPDFWQEHQTVYFDFVTEPGTYQIFAAFYDVVNQPGEIFRYYDCLDLTAEKDFDDYLENVRAKALYDTGIEVAYGDGLLTLSTCSYHVSGGDGRFVVVAKRVS